MTTIAPPRPVTAAARSRLSCEPTKSKTTSTLRPPFAARMPPRHPVLTDAVVGADPGGEVEPRAVDVDREHADVGRRAQELHGEVAEAADPDDHGGRPRFEQRPTALDGVQRRHARVGQRCGKDGVESPSATRLRAGDDDVVGHTAVARNADRSGDRLPADVVLAARARAAPAAAEQLVDRHESSPLRTHALARDDLADDLVAKRHRQREPSPPPRTRSRSVLQTPAASTRSSTSPAPGRGAGARRAPPARADQTIGPHRWLGRAGLDDLLRGRGDPADEV